MEAQVKKWGNSLAIRIPQTMAVDVGFVADSKVDLHVRSGKLIVQAKEKKYSLNELLSKINKRNLHTPTDWGVPSGKEVW